MKQFILRSLVVLIAAIIFVVVVFLLLQFYLGSSPKEVMNGVMDTETTGTTESAETETVVNTPPPEGSIPLNTLPLSDAQRGALQTVGVDPDTFVITPAMIDCGREALGQARIDEIIAGGAPSVTESLQLVKCAN